MSTQTFVNALIGLAREYKKVERRLARKGKAGPAFGNDVEEQMLESGYFNGPDAEAFSVALTSVLYSADPRRKTK